ncbi:hypothetical protein TPY_0476 [Sulfobacillus acidophilus TPY]|nr:hypothetical protein TPY_0476 [Sulfobacillus acidophilus TPY]
MMPCTVLTDPETAFTDFYWWAFSDNSITAVFMVNRLQTIYQRVPFSRYIC